MPPELWDELRARGYLSLAAPAAYGGREIPFARYLELIELFSMSHASIRMIVHVVNGTWRAMDRFATTGAAPQVHHAVGARRDQDRVHADRADRRHRRRSALQRRARGRHVLPERREAPDHVRDDLRLLAALRARGRNARSRRNRRAARRPERARRHRNRDGRVDGRSRHRSRAVDLRPGAGSGRQSAGRRGARDCRSRSADSSRRAASRWR